MDFNCRLTGYEYVYDKIYKDIDTCSKNSRIFFKKFESIHKVRQAFSLISREHWTNVWEITGIHTCIKYMYFGLENSYRCVLVFRVKYYFSLFIFLRSFVFHDNFVDKYDDVYTCTLIIENSSNRTYY